MSSKSDSGPPAWAGFFDPAGWSHFLAVLTHDLGQRGTAFQIDADAGCVRLANGTVLGLTNLAQMCFQANRERWPGIVAHHFKVATALPDTTTPLDFGEARPLLKIRLWARETLPDVPLVAWDIADDLVAVLTFDLPEMLQTVRREDVERWPASKADLWHLALANTRAEGMLRAPALDVGNGAQVHVLEGDATFFAASHVLFIEAYAGVAPAGAVVAVPRRHTVVFHPITDLSVVHAITSMLNVVPRMCHEGPGSITPSLYWWRPGQALMLLPAERSEGGISFYPPAAFTDLLNRLRPR